MENEIEIFLKMKMRLFPFNSHPLYICVFYAISFVFFHLHSHIIFPLHKYAAHTTAAILLRELMCSGWWWWLENVMRSTFPFISSAKLLGIFILFSTYILPQSFESPRCISHKEFIFFGLFSSLYSFCVK